jgi:hypothetical protein
MLQLHGQIGQCAIGNYQGSAGHFHPASIGSEKQEEAAKFGFEVKTKTVDQHHSPPMEHI